MRNCILIFVLAFLLIPFSRTEAQQVAKNYVVVEIGTGTWCGYCPGAAMGADDLVENGHDVAIIENHNGDSYANTASNARNSYYGISGYPTAFFNGGLSVVGGSGTTSMYPTYLTKYNQAIAVMSDFSLSLTYTKTGLDYSATIEIDEPGDYTGTNLVVHLAYTESHIPQSWQGLSELNFVNRGMYPDHNGTDYTGGPAVINIDFTADAGWDNSTSELVAFIQDNDTKEILQADKITLALPTGTNNVALEEINEIPDLCEGNFVPSLRVKNEGSDNITALTIDYSVNSGATTGTFEWTGDPIEFNHSAVIEMDAISFDLLAGNTIELNITAVNGGNDDDPSDNIGSSNFYTAPEGTMHVFLELNTDNYGNEVTWDIRNSEGTVIQSGGPYSNNYHFEDDFWINPDCNSFNIYDSAGDGGGSIELYDSEGTQFFYSDGEYGAGVSQLFTTYAIAPTATVTPEDGQSNVSVTTDILIIFDQAIRLPDDSPISDPAALVTLTNTVSGDPIDFTAVINPAQKRITLTPNEYLTPLNSYNVFVAGGSVENNWDLPLESDIDVTFSTGPGTGVSDIDETAFHLFPNPVQDMLNITIPASFQANSVVITDVYGKTIKEISADELKRKTSIDVSEFSNGVYFCTFTANSSETITKRFVISK